jgi:hypothetical protein
LLRLVKCVIGGVGKRGNINHVTRHGGKIRIGRSVRLTMIWVHSSVPGSCRGRQDYQVIQVEYSHIMDFHHFGTVKVSERHKPHPQATERPYLRHPHHAMVICCAVGHWRSVART